MIPLLHYYFAPVGQPFWQGNIYGNLLASLVLWFGAYFLIIKKHVTCKQPWCWRISKVPVAGTHYKTCVKHATISRHAYLRHVHSERHPALHKLLQNKR